MPSVEQMRRLHAVLTAGTEQLQQQWAEAVVAAGVFPGSGVDEQLSLTSRVVSLMLDALEAEPVRSAGS